ncbi:hypothetical protein MXX22_12935 [Klebsiella pneumoniae]|nr:YdaE family protein [Klebsiella pneumoniae]MDG0746964.1 hypothetical protein [Klebsiella pneumoniae]
MENTGWLKCSGIRISYLARKEKEYCSERCASYDQMAHES